MDSVFDVAIIGGGINGCGCAADAALRGLSVVLFEKDDLASKTSSSSTKLIHGGLRYLENYEFTLVKKALEERQRLLNLAPHIVHPQSLILPYQKHMRPAWLLRLGLFFYDHLSRQNHLPKSKSIHRSAKNAYFDPLNNALKRGFLFYDASTDDARLTLINALQAKKYGASIRTHSSVVQAEAKDSLWKLSIQTEKGDKYSVGAKTLINASGPWVDAMVKKTGVPEQEKMALVQGSHIIVPALYEGKHAYMLQHKDNRVVFVIPYHGYSMIGTTDVAFTGSLDSVQITPAEIDYLIDLVNANFKIKIKSQDIVHTWSGVRPLLANTQKDLKSLSRDYSIHCTKQPAPAITIYGGKITTYRQLAEDALDQLSFVFPTMGASTTKQIPLPGATLKGIDFNQYQQYAKEQYSWLPPELLNRYLFTYGTCMESFLANCTGMKSLGKQFGNELYQVEVDYLVKEEWARTADDVLSRRTKLILNIKESGKRELEDYLNIAALCE